MFQVKVPATTANLGPGFDCLGMALQLYNTITVKTGRSFQISLAGTYKEGLPEDESNLVWRTMCHFWDVIHYPVPSVDLTFHNEIPPARGLGSSSAAIVGGLAAANILAGSPCSTFELLQLANDIEGHPDNVTPALYGGVTLSVATEKEVLPRVLAQAPNLQAVVVIPDTHLNTEQARGILPPDVPRQDAVFNISHVSLLTEAFIRGEYSLLKEGMCDKLHQTQRAALIPGLLETLAAALEAGAYGSALSGSGPTLLALVPKRSDREVSSSMLAMLKKHDINAQAMLLDIDSGGASAAVID